MPSLDSFTGAHATAIKGDSRGEKVLLTRMMDDQPAEDNVNAICGVLCIVAAQLFLPFALHV